MLVSCVHPVVTQEQGLSQNDVLHTIKTNLHEIKKCYELELKSNPSLKGKVSVRFIVDTDGSTESVEVNESSIKSQRMQSCIVSKISSWNFSRPRNNSKVTVNYPFSFSPPR